MTPHGSRFSTQQIPQLVVERQGLWRVVFLNDAVTRMSYAVMVLRKIFGFDEAKATRHMMEAHEQGRTVVWVGLRENAEAYVFSLQQWHLSATIEADETS